jgi:hypothetical protein
MELPNEETLRALVTTYARVSAACGEAVSGAPLVLPTGEFFADAFTPDAPGVARVLRTLIEHSPLREDMPVEIAFVVPDEAQGGGCGSAACGTGGAGVAGGRSIAELDDGYRVFVAAPDVGQPALLAASLARDVGAMVLCEAGEEEPPDAATAEIAAAACGLGVFVASGSSVWAKSCGGLRMAQATALSVEEATVALALFLAVHAKDPSEASRHLEATQREALDLAVAWTESNPWLVETLREKPSLLASGAFSLEPLRGLLGRWLHKRKLESQFATPAKAAPPMSEEKRRRFEEARALVDEVLGDAGE